MLKIGDCIVNKVLQVVLNLLNLLVNSLNLVISLLHIKARDADKRQTYKVLDIALIHSTAKLLCKWNKRRCNRCVCLLNRLLALEYLVYLILDKDTLKRYLVPLIVQLAELNLKLLTKQFLCVLCRVAQNIAHTHKLRVLILNYARVWRDRYLAEGKGIECVDSLIARLARSNMDNNLCRRCSIIVKVLNLNLTLLLRLCDRLLEGLGCNRVWNLGDNKSALVNLRNLCTHLNRATTKTVVVSRHINHTARREVGIELEWLALEMGNCCRDKLVEVVRKNLRCKTYGNTLCTLCKQQRELYRKRYRLLLTTVV